MAKKSVEKVAVASVLAFEKKIVPSDGYMYSASWDTKDELKKIKLVEKSVRGTISNRKKKTDQNDPVKLNKEVEKANLQTVDSASLPMEHDTLVEKFSVKFLAKAEHPSACNEEDHNKRIVAMGEKYISSIGYKVLAGRYAENIANGRFLWRNRVGAEKVLVKVVNSISGEKWEFNAYDYSLREFTDGEGSLAALRDEIDDVLSGVEPFLLLEVTAYAKIGAGQEVYPSEELVLDKGNSKKSKILYAVDGVAAMHSQKIGNALRTIDTWYPKYEEEGVGPIAVEPYGAVTNLGKAFRTPSDKKDFYSLFDRYSAGEDFDSAEDANYVMAVLIRGGVFGQSSKE